MSVWNDMASDSGYRYGTSENEQMAAMLEQMAAMLEAEEYQQQCGREAEARAAAEAEAGEQQATEPCSEANGTLPQNDIELPF